MIGSRLNPPNLGIPDVDHAMWFARGVEGNACNGFVRDMTLIAEQTRLDLYFFELPMLQSRCSPGQIGSTPLI